MMDAVSLKEQELSKKERRLAKNRESARHCRQRKKEKMTVLRQQLAHLEADNLQLRLKLQNDETSSMDQSVFITNKLNELIKQSATEAEIQRTIQELKERFSDYGRDRRSSIDFHISQLRRCLQPTHTTRAILWLMRLASKYHDSASGDFRIPGVDELSALWKSILEEIRPDRDQRKLMVSYTTPVSGTDPFQAINQSTETCNSMLDRIVDIVCNKNDSLDTEMANIQSILSARQIAKFILWIDDNPMCMQMLEALWPHITGSSPPEDNLKMGRMDASASTGAEGEGRDAEDSEDDSSGSDD